MAGRIGLHGFEGETFCNRYFNFGHSGYSQSAAGQPDFMSEYWVPLLRPGSGIVLHDERTHAESYGRRVASVRGC